MFAQTIQAGWILPEIILWPIQAGCLRLQQHSCSRDYMDKLISMEVESGQVVLEARKDIPKSLSSQVLREAWVNFGGESLMAVIVL